jgi:hypothetical protein
MRKNQEHPSKGTPRPHTWKSGPDEVRHVRYFIWLQQRNQAKYRKEEWDLTFDQWLEIWGDKILKRGRKKENYCMTRHDPIGPWNMANTYIIERGKHILITRRERDIYASLADNRRKRQGK